MIKIQTSRKRSIKLFARIFINQIAQPRLPIWPKLDNNFLKFLRLSCSKLEPRKKNDTLSKKWSQSKLMMHMVYKNCYLSELDVIASL